MGARREGQTQHDPRHEEDWPRLAGFGLLVASVLGVLLLGAALRTDAPEGSRRDLAPPPATVDPWDEPPAPTSSRPEPAAVEPAVAPASALDRMARRAAADLERLAGAPEAWTVQLAVLCDTARVEALVRASGAEDGFHLVPAYHGDRPCFRVCWGRFPTRDAAAHPADLPPPLRALVDGKPYARRVAEVLE